MDINTAPIKMRNFVIKIIAILAKWGHIAYKVTYNIISLEGISNNLKLKPFNVVIERN